MITWAAVKLVGGRLLKGVGGFLSAIPWQVYLLAALVGFLIWRDGVVFKRGDAAGYARANAEWQAKYDKDVADYQTRLIDAQARAAAELAEANVRMGEIEQQSLADKEAINAEHEKELAGLRAGTIRVQQRFKCPTVPAGRTDSVPGAAAAAAGRDAAGQAGFNAEDAGVALGIARDGDAAILQLGRAQEVIREYQAICGAQRAKPAKE